MWSDCENGERVCGRELGERDRSGRGGLGKRGEKGTGKKKGRPKEGKSG